MNSFRVESISVTEHAQLRINRIMGIIAIAMNYKVLGLYPYTICDQIERQNSLLYLFN